MLRRSSLFVGPLVAALAGSMTAGSPAEACSQPDGPPGYAPAVRLATLVSATPKNAGLLLDLHAGELTVDMVRARTTIEVRSGDVVLPGALELIPWTTEGRTSGFRPWRWKPESGDLPVGPLAVRVTAEVNGTPRVEIDTRVTIVDRVFTPPSLPVHSVAASRLVIPEADAPVIACTLKEFAPAGCGRGSDQSSTRTRHRGVPQIGWQITQPASEDLPFVRQRVSLYGRDASGTIGPDRREVGEGVVTYLESPYAQYCVELTTRSLIDGAETKNEKCIPGTLSVAVSDEENEEIVEKALASCRRETIKYPPGTSADDPTGQGSGCSIRSTPSSRRSGATCALGLALAIALVTRRRPPRA